MLDSRRWRYVVVVAALTVGCGEPSTVAAVHHHPGAAGGGFPIGDGAHDRKRSEAWSVDADGAHPVLTLACAAAAGRVVHYLHDDQHHWHAGAWAGILRTTVAQPTFAEPWQWQTDPSTSAVAPSLFSLTETWMQGEASQ